MREGGATIETRLEYAFERATLRPATPDEVQALVGLYERRLAELRDQLDPPRSSRPILWALCPKAGPPANSPPSRQCAMLSSTWTNS